MGTSAAKHPRARRTAVWGMTLLAATLGALGGCRQLFGIDEGQGLLAPDGGVGDATTEGASTADGQASGGDAALEGGASGDAGGTSHDACAACADGGCARATDCADPIKQTCADASCAPRAIWGTLHMELPTVTLDCTDQYYADATLQPSDVLLRVQCDKGYIVWSLTVPNSAPTSTSIPFNGYAGPTIFFVSITDASIATASSGAWVGTGSLLLTSMSSSSGGHVHGTFSGTLSKSGSAATPAFSGEIEALLP